MAEGFEDRPRTATGVAGKPVKWSDTQRVGRWAAFGLVLAVAAVILLFVLSALR